ncbi:MAG TPA: hypothetical protein VHZ24_14430 [Pirellulales bacterium]|jgi:hypothetical protein|nr:hypothetical protein [Pirellulales bacterium]
MSLFGGSQREDRRRRVLTDEVMVAGSSTTTNVATASRGATTAGKSDQMDRQPRITDLVPQRYTSYALAFVLGLGCIATLEAAHWWMPSIAPLAGTERLPGIDLAADRNLATWLTSIWQLLAALAAVVIYGVRRHKADDYHGRYRIWLWGAACWLAASVDTGSNLRSAFTHVMRHVSGTELGANGWWIAGYAVVAGPIVVRLLIDMRRCRVSTAVLISAMASYLVASVGTLGFIDTSFDAHGVMIERAGEMLGALLTLVAMGLHARFVIRDAQGLMPAAKAKSAQKKAAEAKAKTAVAATPNTPKRSDLSTPGRPATASSTPAAKQDRSDEDDYDDEDDYGDRSSRRNRRRHRLDDEEDATQGRKLSKADRKLLRRQKLQERRREMDE